MKRVIKYISEIILSCLLIFGSYFAWDRIDVEAYEKYITQYTFDDLQMFVENDFNELVYLNDEELVDDTVLYINNYQNRIYNANVFLVLNGLNENIISDLYLNINGDNYSLGDIYVRKNNDDYYFLISNLDLKEYEKTNFKLKLLVSDSCDLADFTGFTYKIQKEIIG